MAAPLFGVPVVDERNPFRGKGLAITVALLLEPQRAWSLAELARRAEVSRPQVTKVLEFLRRTGCVDGDVSQGRRAAVHAKRALFEEASAHWPSPIAWVLGGRLPSDLPIGGGDVVSAALEVPWDAPARGYVRSRTTIPHVLAVAGGALVTEPVAEWGLTVIDFPFEPGPVPPVIAALELGASPRGRQTLHDHAEILLRDFPD